MNSSLTNPAAVPASFWRTPGFWILVAGNLAPLFGVLFLGWETFPLMLLFWCENVFIGLFNALRMLCATPQSKVLWAAKLFFVPFFCFHYGLFTLVHGVFVVALFGGSFSGGHGLTPGFDTFWRAVQENHLGWPVFCIGSSHLAFFIWDYLYKGEYKEAKLPLLMIAPYGRIVVLHLAILLGAFLLMILRLPAIALLLLVALKFGLDLAIYLKSHYVPGLTFFRGAKSR